MLQFKLPMELLAEAVGGEAVVAKVVVAVAVQPLSSLVTAAPVKIGKE